MIMISPHQRILIPRPLSREKPATEKAIPSSHYVDWIGDPATSTEVVAVVPGNPGLAPYYYK